MRDVTLNIPTPRTARLYEFARAMGVSSTQLREYLNLLGVPAQSASTKITLNPLFVKSVHAHFMRGGVRR